MIGGKTDAMNFLQEIHQSPYEKKKRNKTDIKTEADKELGWRKTNTKAKSRSQNKQKAEAKRSKKQKPNKQKAKAKQANATAKQTKKTGMKEREMEIIE